MRTLWFLIALATIATAARADDIPPCQTPENVHLMKTLSQAPKALRTALAADVGQMAEPGAEFNATDSIDLHLLSNRLIFIWNRGGLWIVATEHGGSIAYNDPVLVYRVSESRTRAALLQQERAYPNSVCSTAKALLKAHS